MKHCPFCGSPARIEAKYGTVYACGTDAPIDWDYVRSEKCRELEKQKGATE